MKHPTVRCTVTALSVVITLVPTIDDKRCLDGGPMMGRRCKS